MGGHEWQRKARAFLATAKDTAESQRLATANAELTERLAAQDDQIKALAAQIAILSQNAASTTVKGGNHKRAATVSASTG
jgi:predicted negative regulator of RcsB-dependent stress response